MSKTKSPSQARATIPNKVQNFLWAKSGGRCEYRGCNELLIGDLVSNTPNANKGYHAHIIADSVNGPRGDAALSKALARDPANLMLLCDTHHRIVDRDRVADHPATILREMKREHETRIEIVTAITRDRATFPLRYCARIASNEALISEADLRLAIISEGRYPVPGGNIDLEIIGLDFAEHEPEFWSTHLRNLRSAFGEKIKGRLERGELTHITVGAVAPIPLLIELGRLLSDIRAVDVRQLLRNPKGLIWDASAAPLAFEVLKPPPSDARHAALKVEFSAAITDDRVERALPGVPIWSIRSSVLGNDVLRRPEDLAEFARVFRATLDAIRAAHGQDVEVALFPAAPPSASVEIGRGWQPKAHPTVRIYDENKRVGGFHFVHALDHCAARSA